MIQLRLYCVSLTAGLLERDTPCYMREKYLESRAVALDKKRRTKNEFA